MINETNEVESKSALEKVMSSVAGRQVELTVRGDRSFTFSFDVIDKTAAQKIAKFFKGQAQVAIDEDTECGTCVYIDIN